MKLIHARYVVDLFKKLSKLEIGTTKIEGLCRKVCDYLPRGKAKKLTKTVVQWKLQDAHRSLRKARMDNTQSWRREKPLLEQENVLVAYEELWSREKSAYAQELRQKLRQKTNFLKTKFRRSNSANEVPGDIEGVIVAEQEIPTSFTSDPRIYGAAGVSTEELDLLNLPPNYTL